MTWFDSNPLLIPRGRPQTLVLDGKIYFLSGHDNETQPDAPDVEAYDPTTGNWKALPNLSFPLGYRFICAALENPNRILVASSTETETGETSEFCQYDVGKDCWELMEKPVRKLHYRCPLGHEGKAVTAGNTLYWVTDNNTKLIAYDVDHDMWLLGSLKGIGISFLEYEEPCPFCLIHLEDERFCIVQQSFENCVEIQCVIIEVYRKRRDNRPTDIYRKGSDNSLGIKVGSVHKYGVEENFSVTHCFLI